MATITANNLSVEITFKRIDKEGITYCFKFFYADLPLFNPEITKNEFTAWEYIEGREKEKNSLLQVFLVYLRFLILSGFGIII